MKNRIRPDHDVSSKDLSAEYIKEITNSLSRSKKKVQW